MHSAYASLRKVPLVILFDTSAAAEKLVAGLRRDGAVVYRTHHPRGCLRVATAVGPDTIIVDEEFPEHIRRLLASHPRTARSRFVRLSQAEVQAALKSAAWTSGSPCPEVRDAGKANLRWPP